MKTYKQREYIEIGSIKEAENIINNFGCKRIFLVTGKGSYQECGAAKALERLLLTRTVFHFNDFCINPNIEDIKKGIDTLRNFSPDFVIAVGGGSVIDMAKAINILSFQKGYPEHYIRGERLLRQGGVPVLAIPTTSGSGSEATHFSVVYIDKLKYSLTHPDMLPIVTIVDPSLTFTLPAKITAVSGADAFCQAMESYWSIKSTQESKSYAKDSLKLALDYLKNVVNNPTEDSRVGMSKSAHLAGKAINISKTTASHALSYPITSHFGIPHGQAVALTLSRLLKYNSNIQNTDVNDPRGFQYVIQTISEIINMLGAESADTASEIIDTLFKDIGLKLRFSNIGISFAHADILLGGISVERMENNPRKLSLANAKIILESLW